MMMGFIVTSFLLILLVPLPGNALGICSHPQDPGFYEKNNYKIGKIELHTPFNFLFLVRQRLDQLRSSLAIKEHNAFDSSAYDESFTIVETAIKADGALGRDSPMKIVAVTSSLENCQENGEAATVDVVYRVFTTDPIPAIKAAPEERRLATEEPATTAAQTVNPSFKFTPHFSYDATRRGLTGLDASVRLPTAIVDSFGLSMSGSTESREFRGGLKGARDPARRAFGQVEYSLDYAFRDTPAGDTRFTTGIVQGRITASTKPLRVGASRILFRYGAAIQQGNQQTDVASGSHYGSLQFYGGATSTTRYSETSASYGLLAGGAGLSNLSYTRHVVDVTSSWRLPGHTNVPWDVTVRLTAGAMTGSGFLVSDRFFGGNAVANLLPGTTWSIPSGPLVRSVPVNRLSGTGTGGTSFCSTNFTIGKVIKGWPLIPHEIENAPGFDDAIQFAEKTAETWFADDYQAMSPEFQALLNDFPAHLKTAVSKAESTLAEIRNARPVSFEVNAALRKAAQSITLAKILVNTASDSTMRPTDRVGRLRAWLKPKSGLVTLAQSLETLETLVPEASPELKSERQSIQSDLARLETSLKQIDQGPGRVEAIKFGEAAMARPREIIDTLRRETNRYSIGVVGIFDAGRVWPSREGTSYAVGGGGRFSLVTVNFTLGYAINPNPHHDLGQGRGALLFAITYTNLFD